MLLRRLYYTIDFICLLLMGQSTACKSNPIPFLAIGQEAQFIALSVKQRVAPHGILCIVIQCSQSVQLVRVMYNRHLVGLESNYTCIPSSAKKFLIRVAALYVGAQGTQERGIKCTMPDSLKSLINSGMTDMLSRVNNITACLRTLQKKVVSSDQAVTSAATIQELIQIGLNQQSLVRDLVEVI